MSRTGLGAAADQQEVLKLSGVSCGYVMERVTRIELALSAWEVSVTALRPPADWLTCGPAGLLTVRDRDCPQWLIRSGA
jgi:hypothetical protein